MLGGRGLSFARAQKFLGRFHLAMIKMTLEFRSAMVLDDYAATARRFSAGGFDYGEIPLDVAAGLYHAARRRDD